MMAFLVVLVVDDPDYCPALLDAWEQIGVSGVTILESSGLGRIRKAGLRDDLPLMPSLRDLLSGGEVHHRTLLSVVETDEQVEHMVQVAQEMIGDLKKPNTGFLFVVPVAKVYGIPD